MGYFLGGFRGLDADHYLAIFDCHTDHKRCHWRLGSCEGIEVEFTTVQIFGFSLQVTHRHDEKS